MLYHRAQKVSGNDPSVRRKWQNIDETVASLCVRLAQGYNRRSLKKDRWLKESCTLWNIDWAIIGKPAFPPCCPFSLERREALSIMGPVYLINILTHVKCSRAWTTPALVHGKDWASHLVHLQITAALVFDFQLKWDEMISSDKMTA